MLKDKPSTRESWRWTESENLPTMWNTLSKKLKLSIDLRAEVPINTTIERIVEAPKIFEKVVKRVVMPQIAKLLKYAHLRVWKPWSWIDRRRSSSQIQGTLRQFQETPFCWSNLENWEKQTFLTDFGELWAFQQKRLLRKRLTEQTLWRLSQKWAMSLVEIKRTKKENLNVKLNLEDDAGLIFFT